MAKKSRKKTSAKRTKNNKKKSRLAPKKTKQKKNVAKKKRKGKIARAYSAVVDTFKGTDKLRNKLEQPGTSESE